MARARLQAGLQVAASFSRTSARSTASTASLRMARSFRCTATALRACGEGARTGEAMGLESAGGAAGAEIASAAEAEKRIAQPRRLRPAAARAGASPPPQLRRAAARRLQYRTLLRRAGSRRARAGRGRNSRPIAHILAVQRPEVRNQHFRLSVRRQRPELDQHNERHHEHAAGLACGGARAKSARWEGKSRLAPPAGGNSDHSGGTAPFPWRRRRPRAAASAANSGHRGRLYASFQTGRFLLRAPSDMGTST